MAARAKAKKATKKRAGGKIKSKGTVAEMPKTAKGNKHNGPPKGGLSDDEKKALINKLDRLHTEAEKARDEARHANNVYRSYLKECKKKGFNGDAYIEARDLDKEDHGTVQQRYAEIGDQLRIRNSNLATEMNLFQEIDVRFTEGAEEEAPAVKGLAAGRAGKRRDENPYPAGSEAYQAYDSNWLEGQKEIAGRMGETVGSA